MITAKPEDYSDANAALAAIKAVGGGVLELTDEYPLSSNLLIDQDKISIVGHGPGSGFVLTGSASMDGITVLGSGLQGSAKNVTAPASVLIGATSLTLDSVSSLVVGQYVLINAVWNGNPFSIQQINEIRSISGNAVEFVLPLACDFDLAYTACTVQQILLRRRVRLANFSVLNESTGSIVNGVKAENTFGCVFEGLDLDGFTTGYGFFGYKGLRNKFSDITASKSGTGGYNDIEFWAQTHARIRGIEGWNSSGFGPGFHHVQQSVVDGVLSGRAAARGIKFQSSCQNAAANLIAEAALGTGIALSGHSHRNLMANLVAVASVGGPGVWFSDQWNSVNGLMNVLSAANGTADMQVFPTDHSNAVAGYRGATPYNGSNSKITVAWP